MLTNHLTRLPNNTCVMLSRWEVVLETRFLLLPFSDLRARLHWAGSCRHPITKPVSTAGLRGDAMHGCLWSEPRHTSWSAMTLQTRTHRWQDKDIGLGHLEHSAETSGSIFAMTCKKTSSNEEFATFATRRAFLCGKTAESPLLQSISTVLCPGQASKEQSDSCLKRRQTEIPRRVCTSVYY